MGVPLIPQKKKKSLNPLTYRAFHISL